MMGIFGIVDNTQGIKSSVSELNTGSFVIDVDKLLDGSNDGVFHVNLIRLLDGAFVLNNLKRLSVEQERYIIRFMKQAGIVTDALNSMSNTPYKSLDTTFLQLDKFLGNYVGD